ncbi:glycosyltransferase family 39 protein [bacterium]|nr:glycosyltransferase family 39 protein [candidate division CSSED10-310 bacterium]
MTRSRWFLIGIILLAAVWMRVWQLETLPDGFFCDEASLGYNAWAISHFGIDETGERMPLYARSLGVKKNPVFVYASMIPIRLFGLSAFSVRLTSAMFGVVTIAGVFWLVFLISGFVPAIIAALFMTILPWNFHFSRIAFELISWPCMFIWGLAFLIFALKRGGWPWIAAGLFIGLSLHSYVMAMPFIPIFLPIFGMVYFKRLIPHWRWLTAGLLIFLLFAVPAAQYHRRTMSSEHYSYAGWWSKMSDQPLKVKILRLADNYIPFFMPEFLYTHGDPNPRHSIRNHGPIYHSLFYLSIAGIVTGLLPPSRFYWMLVTWTLLYPLGTALTNDRFASRSIIGSPLAPIWTAMTVWWLLKLLNRIRIRSLSWILQGAVIAGCIFFVGKDAVPYFRQYFTSYNQQAAHGLYGFQYGYRETLEYMESRRSEFPNLMLTAHNVNEPYIFCLFYNRVNPHYFSETHDFGYTVLRSFNFKSYTLDVPTLFAIHPDERIFFDSYKLHHTVKGYNNTDIFYIIEPLRRRPYYDEWAVRGLKRRMPSEGCTGDYIDPDARYPSAIETLTGPGYWTYPDPNPPIVDLQWHFRDSDPDYPLNPEYVEAEGACWMWFDSSASGTLEIFGSHDVMALWLNGRPIMEPTFIQPESLTLIPFEVQRGWNEWSFRACEDFGDWYFVMTLRQATGDPLVPSRHRIAPPGMDDYPRSPINSAINNKDLSP